MTGTTLRDSSAGVWSKLPDMVPSPRYWHAAIYDSSRDRMVVFGGRDGVECDDTYVLSLSGALTWTRLETQGEPPPGRCGHSAIYDPVRDRMVIFGGGFPTTRNDVWTLSLSGPPTWTELTPTGTPPGERRAHTAIYDPLRDRMVVFGGTPGSGYLGDTWALSLAGIPAWIELTPEGTGPPERVSHAAIYDPVRDRMLIFGGSTGSLVNDTWALSLSEPLAWTALEPSGTPPAGRSEVSATYDPLRDRMLVFAGCAGSAVNDTWELSLAGSPAWSEIEPSGSPPDARWAHSAIYDAARDRLVIFGGCFTAGPPFFGDTWELSLGGTPAWTELAPAGFPPSARVRPAAVYDPVRDRMLVLGGIDSVALNDVWELSLAAIPHWSQLSPVGTPPPARSAHTAIYDPPRNRVVIFGGYDDSTHCYDDTWALSLSGTPAWSELAPEGSPPAGRAYHTAIYDPLRDRMVVFGGYAGDMTNAIWELSLSGAPAWNELTPAGTPPSERAGHVAIYDPVRDRMVVFGGEDPVFICDDTWVLSLSGTPAWSELTPGGTPPPGRCISSAIYDPVRDRMVIFGGHPYPPDPYFLNDTWALSLSGALAWSELLPSGTLPPARYGHAAICDSLRDRMVVFGGTDGTSLDDTWLLTWPPPEAPHRVWHVPADAATIQAGVDSAADGDTVLVAEGTYTGVGNRDLDFGGKNLILASESGPELTVIDCLASGRGLYFHSGESPAAEVRGFTIKNGYVSGAPGGGIYIGDSSPTLVNCIISGNQAPEGAGVFVASEYGTVFSGCSILANETLPGGNGGGGVMADSSSASFTDCVITGNQAAGATGGGVHCRKLPSPIFTRCRITENSAAAGGGVSLTSGSYPDLISCTVSGNQAGNQGGGLYVNGSGSGSYSSWQNSILWGNFAPAGGEAWFEGISDGTAFWCSAVDSSRLAVGVGAEVYYGEGNLFTDPLFCRPACGCGADTSALFTLAVNSPCLPVSSPCGELIGSEGQGCDSVLVWVGEGDGKSWGDPYNWDAGRIPHAGDHVQITRGVGDHVRLTQAATIAELTVCGRGLVTDTLEIAGNGHLEVPKVRTTEEILLTEGEALGRGDTRFMVPGQLVVQADTLRNLPGGEVAMEVGAIAGSGAFLNYDGARFAKRGIGAGEVGLDFKNGGRGVAGDTAVVDVLAGTLAVSDSLVNQAMLTVEAGAVLEVQDCVSNLGSGVFQLRGLLTGGGVVENYGLFEKTGWDTSRVSLTFRNLREQSEAWVGEAKILQGILVVQGLLENAASLKVEPGAFLDVENRVSNLAAGVLDLKGKSSGSGAIDNLGLFEKTGPGLSSVTASLNNLLDAGGGARGRIEVGEDTLAVATLDNDGIVSIAAGAALAVSDSLANQVNATVEGGGTLDVSGAAFTNEGIVSPGSSAGVLYVVGDFAPSPSAEINVEIGGKTPVTEYDVLSITGSADLGGALHVSYVGGFTPSPGDTFTLIQISEASQAPAEDLREGGFQCFSGLQLPGGLFMDPVQLPDAFLLVAMDSVPPNSPPTAEPDTASVGSATHIVLHPIRNDVDPDADPLTIATLSTAKTAGQVFLNAGDTTITYVPPFFFAGWDSFAYVATDCQGASDSAVVAVEVGDVTDVPPTWGPLAMLRPLSNYPNPFNPLTTIGYVVAAEGPVRLAIYDVQGRLVRTLVNARQAAGAYSVLWDGVDARGEPAASGIYFLRLTATEKDETRRMVLVR